MASTDAGSNGKLDLPDEAVLNRIAVSESGFLFDPVSGDSFTLNETGLAVLRLVRRTREAGALAAALAQEFDVSEEQAERDLIEFAASLRACLKP
jgi:hypothetical protein